MIPDPMTPPECDLRDYPWMPLDVRRLLTSETWMVGPAEGKVAALSLWCEAWCQVPAGSLPNNDTILEHLSQARRAWPKIREHALRGWVLCSDGRLYHPVVAEKVRESWERKLAQKGRTEAARKAKAARREVQPTSVSNPPVTTSVTETVTDVATEHVTDAVTGSTRTEQNRTEQTKTERKQVPPIRPPLAADASAEPPPTRTKEARGVRLREDWQPSEADRAFAVSLRLDPDEVAAEFRAYWLAATGQTARKTPDHGWSLTYQNRCRELSKRLSSKPMSRRQTPSEAVTAAFGPSLYANRFDLDAQFETSTTEPHRVRIN